MKYVNSASTSIYRVLARRVYRLAILGTVALVFSGIVLRRVSAEVDAGLLDFGSRAMTFPGASPSETRLVRINGVGISMRSEVVHAGLTEVLAHYRGVCAHDDEPRGYMSVLAALATRSVTTTADGYVACVDIGAASLDTLAGKLHRFSETWDLADLGRARYVYAQRAHDRPTSETFVLTMWSSHSLSLRDLLPADGDDALGSDPAGIPRLPNTQRLLSAKEDLEPSGVFVYRALHTSPSDLISVYRQWLRKHAWRIIERNPGESVQIDDIHLLSAERASRQITFVAHANDSGGTLLTLLTSELP